MECDCYEVLHKVVRISNQTSLDYPKSFKAILCFLRKEMGLKEASLLLLDERQKFFARTMQATGNYRFRPCFRRPNPLSEGLALEQRLWTAFEGAFSFPVFNSRRNYGVLTLVPSQNREPSEACLKLMAAVCDQLACLAQYALLSGEERQRVGQLTLLSELGRELNQTRTLQDLLSVAVSILLRYSQAACVVLRPLYGDTVLGRSFVKIAPPYQQLQPLFFDLEEEYSAKAMNSGEVVYFQGLEYNSSQSLSLPQAMVSIPLNFQGRTLGTLTLFGDGDDTVIPLRDEGGGPFFSAIGSQVAHALERVAGRERLVVLSAENDRKFREISLLYRISHALHSTLRLNEVIHLILSATTVAGGGGFGRAMLFTVNERTRTLQGMLGVTRETAALVLPPERGEAVWEHLELCEETQQAQREAAFCRQVMKQRLPLAAEDNPLAQAVLEGKVVRVSRPDQSGPGARSLAEALQLSPYACVPLLGKERPLGVLVVDDPETGGEVSADRLKFLELFANQASGAMENSLLLQRLQTTHKDLRETQEKLIQGEKLAALGEMAASVAHELRNPLVSIGGFANRLTKICPEESREYAYGSIIVRETRRMEGLLSDVLEFSKKQMLCLGECDINGLLEEALALEEDSLTRAGIEVLRDLNLELVAIRGDEQKLLQVLINLIGNARQVMDQGGTLAVTTYRCALRGEEAVAVEIRDSGGGVPADVLGSIFQPFFTTKAKGTGLGLPISQRIVDQHNGQIEVQNWAKGALFTVRLPVCPKQGDGSPPQ